MRHVIHIIAVIICSLTVCSCTDEPPAAEPRLVVEGWIDSDGYPVVILTSTAIPSQDGGDLMDNMIRWGKVSISDGTETVILTGGPDNQYFPPYTYRTYRMQGRVGKTYTIEAEYADMKCHASSTLLPPPAIDSITLHPIEDNPPFYAATLYMTSTGEGCYRIFTRVLNSETRHYPALMGTFRTGAAGERVSIPVFRGKHATDTVKFAPQFLPGEVVDVMVCHIDPAAYDFWTDYDNTVTFGGGMFSGTPDGLRSNITGGYGLWSARGVTRRTLRVPPASAG